MKEKKMKKVSFPDNRTPTKDMFYLFLEDLETEVMIYQDQDKAKEGEIYVYPVQPQDTEDVRFFRIQPHYVNEKEVFYAWYSYFYLNDDEEKADPAITNVYLGLVGSTLPDFDDEEE